MKKATIVFAVVTLILTLGAFALIATSASLSIGQLTGVGIAFLAGWIGLAYAGSDAIRGMLRRRLARLASREALPVREAAVTRRFWRENPPADVAPADEPGQEEGLTAQRAGDTEMASA